MCKNKIHQDIRYMRMIIIIIIIMIIQIKKKKYILAISFSLWSSLIFLVFTRQTCIHTNPFFVFHLDIWRQSGSISESSPDDWDNHDDAPANQILNFVFLISLLPLSPIILYYFASRSILVMLIFLFFIIFSNTLTFYFINNHKT